jgi:hypothetical protein
MKRHRFHPWVPSASVLLLAAACSGEQNPRQSSEQDLPHSPASLWMEQGREAALEAAAGSYQPVKAVRDAFGAFGMEDVERHWQGVWQVGPREVWHVDGNLVTQYRRGLETVSLLFEVDSPCSVLAVLLEFGDGSFGSSEARTTFVIEGGRTYIVQGDGGGYIDEREDGSVAVVACHFGGTTTMIDGECTLWESDRSADSGGELRFRKRQRACGIERGADGSEHFHYERGNFGTQESLLRRGALLVGEKDGGLVREAIRYGSLEAALAAMNAADG